MTADVYNETEEYVLQLYDNERLPAISSFAELRWYMISKHQYESEKLPPTKTALDQKVRRAQYTVLKWKSAYISSPTLTQTQTHHIFLIKNFLCMTKRAFKVR